MNTTSVIPDSSEWQFAIDLVEVVASFRTEIFLFLVAAAVHAVLFRQSSPLKRDRARKKAKGGVCKDFEVNTQPNTQPRSSSKAPGTVSAGVTPRSSALLAAVAAKDSKQVLRCWEQLKERSATTTSALGHAIDAMQRLRKDPDVVAQEVRHHLESQPLDDSRLHAANTVLEMLSRRSDAAAADKVMAALPSLGVQPDTLVYETLLNMHFTIRNFDAVFRLSEEMRSKAVPRSMKVLLTMAKAALRKLDLDESILRFRELKSHPAWPRAGAVTSSVSAAPLGVVAQLVQLACKEHRLADLLPHLSEAPLEEEVVNAMLLHVVRKKHVPLIGQVLEVLRTCKVEFTENTWKMLFRGLADGPPERVVELVDELISKRVEVSMELTVAALAACSQQSDVTTAIKLLEYMQPTRPHMLAAFIRFFVEQCQFEKACDMYQDIYLKSFDKQAAADPRLEKAVMTAALRCGRQVLAAGFLDSAPSDVAKHIAMIRNCASENNLQGAKDVFFALERSCGESLNSQVYNTVLDACAECNAIEEAEAWMLKMKEAGFTDVVSYNTLIKVHLRAGSFDRARGLMAEMKNEGVQPNRVTYNELVNATVAQRPGRTEQIWTILDEMKAVGLGPNQITCSILLKNLNSRSSERDVMRTMDLINDLAQPLDEVLLSSVVEACVRIGKPELLSSKLSQLHGSSCASVNGSHTFGSLIKAYGYAKDIKGVWRCWNEMRSRRIRPTAITLGCMVEAVVSNGDTEGAYALVHEMLQDPQCSSLVNSVIYCSVLKGFTRERKMDRVWVIYEEMVQRKVDLSVVTYNTVLDACARCGHTDRIADVFRNMHEQRIDPNIITYSSMLKGHCQAGDVDKGFEILEHLKTKTSLKPDEIMYNSLLDGCAQGNLTDRGLQVLQMMEDAGVTPSNFTLSILVKLMSRARRLDQAFELVQDISKRHRFALNVHVYSNLIQACTTNRQLDRALETMNEMLSARIEPENRTYAILLRGCLQQGQHELCMGLLRAALGMAGAWGVAPPTALQNAACRGLESNLVNEVLMSLVSRGFAQSLAAPFITDLKLLRTRVRIDPSTQYKVMSATFNGNPVMESRGVISPTPRHHRG